MGICPPQTKLHEAEARLTAEAAASRKERTELTRRIQEAQLRTEAAERELKVGCGLWIPWDE